MKRQFFYTITFVYLVVSINAEVLYNVIDLGEGTAWSINNNGQVVGGLPDSAILFDTSGGGNNTILGGTAAYAINDNSQIVGYREAGPLLLHAMLFDSTGQGNNIDLTPTATRPSYARSINIHGQVVGDSFDAFLFDPTGKGNNLNLGQGVARSINDNGQIVGQNLQAVLFDSTGQQNNINLGTLGGDFSGARSINNAGQIVGSAMIKTGWNAPQHAALFDPTGGGNNVDLGTVGTLNSEALCINNRSQVVGRLYQELDRVGGYATLFDISGQGNNILLNTLIDPSCGWNLTIATAINDNGWIVGSGINPDGLRHAYLLTPIPEPATLLLLGMGGMLMRRKRQ